MRKAKTPEERWRRKESQRERIRKEEMEREMREMEQYMDMDLSFIFSIADAVDRKKEGGE